MSLASGGKITGMQITRLPRFKRSTNIAGIRLDRDRQILREVGDHRFLRSEQITSLLPGSKQQSLRRLQLLYHHGFLERPRCQIDYYHRGGSRSIAYGLANKGAGLLKRELSLPFHRLDRPKDQSVHRLFLEHALLVSEVMVRVELACRSRSDIRLLSPSDLASPSTAGLKREPLQWKVEIAKGRACSVIPDRVFGLEFANRPPGENRIWFCLEADRGTMPITRRNLDQSSFYRKLFAYEATWTHQLPLKIFGGPRFRVLTVTANPTRLAKMIEVCCGLERGRGLFLFTHAEELGAGLLNLFWHTCRGKATLLD